MNHSVNSDLFGCEYAEVQRNRARAIIALAAMPVKKIYVMGPADFAPKEPPRPVYACEKDKERALLGARCITELMNYGPQTTAQIGRRLRVSVQLIISALEGRVDVSRSKVCERSKKTGYTQTVTLWSATENSVENNQPLKAMKNESI